MHYAPDLAGCALEERYELRALVGEGTFGRVYEGYDRRLARTVAVKVMKPWWAEDPDWSERFQREAQLLARVNDPGIVQIFDVGRAEEGLYYVAEFVDGESLASRLSRGPLPPWEACSIVERVCRGLAHAHACGVVHRDIKPANVLVSARGVVKVADFGVARLVQAGTQGPVATIVGTPRYMAPEQARGSPITPATDVYSAGVVLYETLAGHPPFAGDSPVELALHHLQDAPPSLPGTVPRGLAAIVDRALAKDPGSRYPSGEAMAAALARARAHPGTGRLDPTLPAPLMTPRRNVNPSARRRSAALLGMVLALVLAMVAGALALRGPAGVRVLRRKPQGPPPVKVPLLLGEDTSSATAVLRSLGLEDTVAAVPAPGVAPGVVTRQSPGGGTYVGVRTNVALAVAEVPRWRQVSAFSGQDAGRSAAFRIQGDQWRVVYRMNYVGMCTFIFFCSGPSAEVSGESGPAGISFKLRDGGIKTRVFHTAPGIYRIAITPGRDTARWTMQVQDDF